MKYRNLFVATSLALVTNAAAFPTPSTPDSPTSDSPISDSASIFVPIRTKTDTISASSSLHKRTDLTDYYSRDHPKHPCHGITDEFKCDLTLSLWFFEAQKQGSLPADNRVWWAQNNTFLQDGADVGVDLTGGFADAGDYIKYGLPGAYATMMVAWGAVDYALGYLNAGQAKYLFDTIKWGTDHIIKSHPKPDVFYHQVGIGDVDDDYWGRPLEDPFQARTSLRVDATHAGSDVAAQASAALYSAAIVFQSVNPTYAKTLLSHARSLLTFADQYHGTYDQWNADPRAHYGSSDYNDELALAYAWSYRATGNKTDLACAETIWVDNDLGDNDAAPGWDNKVPYVTSMLAVLTGKDVYHTSAERYFNRIVTAPTRTVSNPTASKYGMSKTPGGLLWFRYDSPPSLVNAMAASFAMAYYIDHGFPNTTYAAFSDGQLKYALGCNPNNINYMAASNPTSPRNIHHPYSESSTVDDPAPNKYPLYGALVGGPNVHDVYFDKRSNWAQSEPALDYNGPLTGLLARKVAQEF
ncbi:cellulase [Synchytrium microbalum]|uniref:cellulase n=1 Tax=Synchytrium microbalum TaxID=1806994 RepID=A0A507BUA6_9FUNG|nr:cellulase [Synchytrium microbalum]TPX30619.1 cellulase [Synchytrium microbalum]